MTAMCTVSRDYALTPEEISNETSESKEILRRIHWHRNVEKHNVMVEGMLMVLALKEVAHDSEIELLKEMVENSRGFEGQIGRASCRERV